MKRASQIVLLFVLAAIAWAQTPQSQEPPPPPMSHSSQPGPGMHEKHMQEMKAQVERMRATLDQMKANLARVKDPALKQQSQLDADLWEAMVHHLEGMVAMMSQDGQMAMAPMPPMEGSRTGGCCAGMHHGGGCCGMKDGEAGKCMQHEAPPPPAGPAE